MKKKDFTPPMCQILTLTACLFLTCNTSMAQIKVKSDGKIGIGTNNPSTYLEIYRNVNLFRFPHGTYTPTSIYIKSYYSQTQVYPASNHQGYLGLNTNFWYRIYADKMFYIHEAQEYSDKKFKKNIINLNNSLSKILQLQGVQYDIIPEAFGIKDSPEEDPDNFNKIGLIAQDVMKIIPEIVEEDSLGYSIAYTRLIPILIEAIKEQNEMILDLEKKVKEDIDEKSADIDLNKSAANPSSIVEAMQVNEAYLGQNMPNPFNQNTTIEYYLPSTIQKAQLYIYDMQGKQIKSINIIQREMGQVVIYGNELNAGMYHYSIIADGEMVGMEKMILTD